MSVRLAFVAATVVAFATPGLARADSSPAFKTPGGAAYCQMEFSHQSFNAFRCFTPNDGWWIRLTGVGGPRAQVSKGYDDRYRGYHPSSYRLLPFGRTYWSSDAEAVTCWSRSTGLTCKEYNGLSFWIGRYKGYRIFVSPAGSRTSVTRPFFRTSFGVYCGLGLSMEPDAPYVACWRASDGLDLSLGHAAGYKGSWSRNENDRGHQPGGYPALSPGGTFRWTCASVDAMFATGCTANGAATPVLTCVVSSSRLTCRSDTGHGFWVDRSSFYTY